MKIKQKERAKTQDEIFHIGQVHKYNLTNQIVTAPKRKFEDGDWVKIIKLNINPKEDNNQ